MREWIWKDKKKRNNNDDDGDVDGGIVIVNVCSLHIHQSEPSLFCFPP